MLNWYQGPWVNIFPDELNEHEELYLQWENLLAMDQATLYVAGLSSLARISPKEIFLEMTFRQLVFTMCHEYAKLYILTSCDSQNDFLYH